MNRFSILAAASVVVLAGSLSACGKKGNGYDNTRTGNDYYTVERIPSEPTGQQEPSMQNSEGMQGSSQQGRASGGGIETGSQWDGGVPPSSGELFEPPAGHDGGLNAPGDVFKGTTTTPDR